MSIDDFKTYHIETDFGTLAYHAKGNTSSKKAFIFLHGHLDSAFENGTFRIFDFHSDVLQILLDHRWHGSSIRTEFYPSITEKAEDIDIFLRNLRLQFPQVEEIYLIGHSQGASVLLRYLLHNYPVDVTAAFIIAPRFDLKGYMKWFDKEIMMLKENPESQAFTKKYRSKGYVSYNRKYLIDLEEFDLKKSIKSLATPSVLIRGENDDLISREESAFLVDEGNNFLSYYEIPDCGHNLEIKHWHAINDYVYNFANK